MHWISRCSLLLIAVALPPRCVFAQQPAAAYPSKPVRIISGQATGGTDVQARLYAARLSESLGRQFIVENHPGLHTALTMVAKSPPDGHALLVVVPSFTFGPALYKNLPVDPLTDFAPVSLMSRAPYFLVVHPAVPAKSMKELIGLARAHPGKLNFAAGLTGSGTHLISMYFLQQAEIKATYVPYKGVAQAVVDQLGGRIDAVFSTGVPIVPHMKIGKLRALGVSTAQRARDFPEIPTIAEQGVRGFDASTFHGWAAPAGTPPAIINKLAAELARIAKMPDVAEKLKADISEPVGSTPEQFAQFIAAEVPRWRKLAQDAAITVDQ